MTTGRRNHEESLAFVLGRVRPMHRQVLLLAAGDALMSGHVVLSLGGAGFASFASALFLFGVGWDFLYVGGTTMLTRAYLPAEAGLAQAANDLLMFVVGLASSLSSGALLNWVGWQRMMSLALRNPGCNCVARVRTARSWRPHDHRGVSRGE
jgi:hypothetical protein